MVMFGDANEERPGGAGANGGGNVVMDATTASFTKDVIEASRDQLVLVDFWADWCGPCKQLTPVLEKIVESYGGTVRLVKVNVDENQALAAQLRIQSLPTVYAFKDGRPLDGFMGVQPESAIRDLISRCGAEEAGAADLEQILAAGEEAIETGALQEAASLFAAVLQEDQHEPRALAGLAVCYLRSGDAARAQQTLELVPPNKADDPAVVSAKAAIELAAQAEDAGPIGELQSAVAANPDDHQARFDLALAAAGTGDKDAAVDALLEIFRRDREWNEQAARKQLLKFFEAWGAKDKATIDGRRKLSALLFA